MASSYGGGFRKRQLLGRHLALGGRARFCTGRPTGVIRYREPLKNFELLLEWMHKKKGGNSGVFVWGTPASIAKLAAGHGRLPHGIEVQVLDLGYAEVYTQRHKKPADWFTSHGHRSK